DLVTAASEVASGLAGLNGAELAEEEARLLAAGASIVADLARLPSQAHPRDARWLALVPTFPTRVAAVGANHAQPEVAAYCALAAAEHAREQGTDDRATWRAVG